MDFDPLIDGLESAIPDPRGGLPEPVFRFVSRLAPLINVDLLIQDDRGTLLTWREDEIYGAGWHVPGGIIRYKERARDRIVACAREELSAEVSFDEAPFEVVESFLPGRDRGHFISLLYRCRLLTAPDEARKAMSNYPFAGAWRWHRQCPPNLIPAHKHYAKYLQ